MVVPLETVRRAEGVVVPIPTLPVSRIVILSVVAGLKARVAMVPEPVISALYFQSLLEVRSSVETGLTVEVEVMGVR